jgi:hypothetical protein
MDLYFIVAANDRPPSSKSGRKKGTAILRGMKKLRIR